MNLNKNILDLRLKIKSFNHIVNFYQYKIIDFKKINNFMLKINNYMKKLYIFVNK